MRDAPDQVYLAVRSAFPGAAKRAVTTVIADDGVHQPILWFRVVRSETKKLDISVRITQPRPSDRISELRTSDRIGRVVTKIMTRSNELRVDVVITSKDATSSPPPFATLRALATDPRLMLLQ